MTKRRHMTREHRQHYYHQWRESGMNKNQYARHQVINIKTPCRALDDKVDAGSLPSSIPALLSVVIELAVALATRNITLTLSRAAA